MTFPIAIECHVKHAGLRKAVAKLGSQSALASHLGVWASEIGRWCNLQACPSFLPRWWPQERIDDLEKKLFNLTGETLDELWPAELRENTRFLNSTKTAVIEQEVDLALLAHEHEERLTLPSPEVEAEAGELRERMAEVVGTLSFREREIIKLRYGLEGGHTYSLEEVAHIFKVTSGRVCQIEAKAIRKLQQPYRSASLVGLLD